MRTFIHLPKGTDPTTFDPANPPQDCKLCIAGWALALAGYQPYLCPHDPNAHIFFDHIEAHILTAAELLGIRPEIAGQLFYLSGWPVTLQVNYDAAVDSDHYNAIADVMCDAIDHFIPEQPTP